MIYLGARFHSTQINKICFSANTYEHQIFGLVECMAVMLIGATALATDDAFADKKKKGYEKNQAVSQANACGNGEEPLNVGCQNTASQIQGEENSQH